MAALQPEHETIPAELIARAQWVAWVLEQRDGKPTKVPKIPATGGNADTTNPATWGTYAQARHRAASILAAARVGGVGFVLTGHDPFGVADLDHCRNPETGVIADDAAAIIRKLGSYTEVSPSGTGVHVLIRGAVPGGGNRKMMPWGGPIEMYSTVRYITVTGDHLESTPEGIQHAQDALNKLHSDIFPPLAPKAATAVYRANSMDDTEVIARAMNASNGYQFRALWNGSTDGHGGDDSGADLALCNHLMFYTGNDKTQTDRLFRDSGLMREKWEREDYRERTLEAAMQSNVYTGPKPKPPGGAATITPISRNVDTDTGEVLDTPTPRRPLTDLGNAERLIDRFGDIIRYVVERGTWATYADGTWAIDTTGGVWRLACETVRGMYREAGDSEGYEDRAALAKYALKCEATARITAMLEHAKNLPGVTVSLTAFDHNPMLLNCVNGVIDLHAGELRPHDPADLLMKQIPVVYDPDAVCPTWDTFLAQAMEPHPAQVGFLRRAVGYSLTGNVKEEVFFLLHGAGGNGKGTFTETIEALLTDYAQQAEMRLLMVRRSDSDATPDIARLTGVRAVFASESESGAHFNEAKVKALTGGDSLSGRFLFQNPFQFRPTHKLWLATNYRPVIRGTDEGIWRRILLIPFAVEFRGAHRDLKLKQKLLAELPGILAWAVRGCLEWQRDGLGVPADITDATGDYRREMDTLAAFVADHCEEGKAHFVTSTALYKVYRSWCDQNGEHADSQRAFGLRLKASGFTDGKRNHQRGWNGLRLLNDAFQEGLDT